MIKSWPRILILTAIIVYIPLWIFTVYIADLQRNLKSPDLIFPVIGSDSHSYQILSENLARKGAFVNDNGVPETFRTPGYPLFISLISSLTGSYFSVTFAQIILTVLSSILIFLLIGKYIGNLEAKISSLVFLLGINPLTNSLILMSDTLFLFLFILSIYLIFYPEEPKISYSIIAGLVLGFGTLVRQILIFALPIMIFFLFIFYRKKQSLKNLIFISVIIVFFQMIVLLPWFIRNEKVSGVFSLSSLSAYNLFHYNLPEYRSFSENITPVVAREYFESQISDEARNHQDSLQYSHELQKVSSEYLKQHFLSYSFFHLIKTGPFFLSSGWKTAIDVHNSFFSDDRDYEIVQSNLSSMFMKGDVRGVFEALSRNPLTASEQFFWAVVFLAMIYGFCRNYRNKIVWLFITLIFCFAILTGPVSYSRYRLPVEPLMLSLAVIGIMKLHKDTKDILSKFS